MRLITARRIILFLAALLLALPPRPAPAIPDLSGLTRIALVIGNGRYTGTRPLRNPESDAERMAETLIGLGFDTKLLTDLKLAEMKIAVGEFGQRLRRDTVGLFYYAGHGVQVNGKNYMLPVDARIRGPHHVISTGVQVDEVLEVMKVAGNAMNLLILDACREDPFRDLPADKRGGLSRGLAGMAAPGGTKILFSTEPGREASDESAFLRHLITQMQVPGQELEQMIKSVTAGVYGDTGAAQRPYQEGNLMANFYFSKGKPPEDRIWETVKDTTKPAVLEWFLEQNPAGPYSNRARTRLAALREEQEGQSTLPPPPAETILKVDSTPSGAAVWLDGKHYGAAPIRFRITRPRIYLAKIEATGYQPYEESVDMRDMQPKSITADLAAAKVAVETGPIVVSASNSPDDGPISNSIGMTFIYIPPGEFLMGSPETEPQRDSDETQHRVRLTKGYYLQSTEVTQAQWQKVMGDNPSRFKDCGGDCPVETVSWNDVQRFIGKLNSMERTDRYRLPTEAEWEYACRAGTTGPFAFGGCLSTDQANYDGNYPLTGCAEGKYREAPVSVTAFSPNAWGFYNMHGNVWEWCLDVYGAYGDDSAVKVDPIYAGNGSDIYAEKGANRVVRGGGWDSDARDCRSANRYGLSPGDRNNDVGFRLARTR